MKGKESKSFRTERMSWAKVMQFPMDALKVNVPLNNVEKKLQIMRDVFRSRINVKVIYTQVLPPQKTKKGKKAGKDKKGKMGKDKKSKKGTNKSSTGSKGKKGHKNNAEDKKEAAEEKPQETLVKKITLASFDCDLQHPNWAVETLDYYWCKHGKFPQKIGSPVQGSLRAIVYKESKKKKGKDKKSSKKGKDKKSKKGTDKSSTRSKGKKGTKRGKGVANNLGVEEVEEPFVIMKEAPVEDFLPDVFTVQIGFGLCRWPFGPNLANLAEANSPEI